MDFFSKGLLLGIIMTRKIQDDGYNSALHGFVTGQNHFYVC
jgi:hypothetical protein